MAEASTTVVNVNAENVDKLMDFIGSVIGAPFAKPSNLTEFTAMMVQHANALIEKADEKDTEGCFQVLFKDIQVIRLLWIFAPLRS